MGAGDSEWFKAHLSAHNPIMFGSDPKEKATGSDAVMEITRRNSPTATAMRLSRPLRQSSMRASQETLVGRSPNPGFEDGSYVPVHGLTILHREEGVWKLIAAVAAPAIANSCFDRITDRTASPRLGLAASPRCCAWRRPLGGSIGCELARGAG